MEVLLISPKDPKIPGNLKFLMSGESTYTNTLLKYPPENVRYTYLPDALKNGQVEFTIWQTILSWLIKVRIFPLDSGYHCIRLKKKFDLIHSHAYNLKLGGSIKPPIILGDSSSNYLFLRDYLGWSIFRIRVQYALRIVVHKILKVYDRDLNIADSKYLVVFSEFAKKVHVNLGGDSNKIVVISPGLPARTKKVRRSRLDGLKRINILFAGVWFERKGGIVLLDAYRLLKKKYPYIKLTLLGPLPRGVILRDRDVIHHDFVSYSKLCREFYPSADIFVLVPPRAEGYGMVVLEAATFGIPAIVSSVYALPEIVENGKTGFVIMPNSMSALVVALERLITNKKLREKMGKAARERFKKNFWIEVTNRRLLKVYQSSQRSSKFKIMG